jgi:glycosyltransferase involved in cell wall biosynthesis
MSRILVIGENFHNNTGYGKITRQVRNYLSEQHDVRVLGYYTQERSTDKDLMSTADQNVLLTNNQQIIRDDMYGRMSIVIAVHQFKPDVILTIGDIWYFPYLERFRAAYPDIFIMGYYPMEANTQPAQFMFEFAGGKIPMQLLNAEKAYDRLIMYSETSHSLRPDTSHGHIYHAMCDKDIAEDDPINLDGFNDKIIIGTVLRVQYRKAIDQMLLMMRRIKETAPDVYEKTYLYIHAAMMDVDNIDVHAVAKDIGVDDRVMMANDLWPNVFFRGPQVDPLRGVSRGQLNRIMRKFFAYISLSYAEGFCLPLIEAAALEVPVIYHDFLTMGEIMKGIGTPVKSLCLFKAKMDDRIFTMPDAANAADIIIDAVRGKTVLPKPDIKSLDKFMDRVISSQWLDQMKTATKPKIKREDITLVIHSANTPASVVAGYVSEKNSDTHVSVISSSYFLVQDTVLLTTNPSIKRVELIYARGSVSKDDILKVPDQFRKVRPDLIINATILHDYDVFPQIDGKYNAVRIIPGTQHNMRSTIPEELEVTAYDGKASKPIFIGSNESNEGLDQALAMRLPVIIRTLTGVPNKFNLERQRKLARNLGVECLNDTDDISDRIIYYWSDYQSNNDIMIWKLMQKNTVIGAYRQPQCAPFFGIKGLQFANVIEFTRYIRSQK